MLRGVPWSFCSSIASLLLMCPFISLWMPSEGLWEAICKFLVRRSFCRSCWPVSVLWIWDPRSPVWLIEPRAEFAIAVTVSPEISLFMPSEWASTLPPVSHWTSRGSCLMFCSVISLSSWVGWDIWLSDTWAAIVALCGFCADGVHGPLSGKGDVRVSVLVLWVLAVGDLKCEAIEPPVWLKGLLFPTTLSGLEGDDKWLEKDMMPGSCLCKDAGLEPGSATEDPAGEPVWEGEAWKGLSAVATWDCCCWRCRGPGGVWDILMSLCWLESGLPGEPWPTKWRGDIGLAICTGAVARTWPITGLGTWPLIIWCWCTCCCCNICCWALVMYWGKGPWEGCCIVPETPWWNCGAILDDCPIAPGCCWVPAGQCLPANPKRSCCCWASRPGIRGPTGGPCGTWGRICPWAWPCILSIWPCCSCRWAIIAWICCNCWLGVRWRSWGFCAMKAWMLIGARICPAGAPSLWVITICWPLGMPNCWVNRACCCWFVMLVIVVWVWPLFCPSTSCGCCTLIWPACCCAIKHICWSSCFICMVFRVWRPSCICCCCGCTLRWDPACWLPTKPCCSATPIFWFDWGRAVCCWPRKCACCGCPTPHCCFPLDPCFCIWRGVGGPPCWVSVFGPSSLPSFWSGFWRLLTPGCKFSATPWVLPNGGVSKALCGSEGPTCVGCFSCEICCCWSWARFFAAFCCCCDMSNRWAITLCCWGVSWVGGPLTTCCPPDPSIKPWGLWSCWTICWLPTIPCGWPAIIFTVWFIGWPMTLCCVCPIAWFPIIPEVVCINPCWFCWLFINPCCKLGCCCTILLIKTWVAWLPMTPGCWLIIPGCCGWCDIGCCPNINCCCIFWTNCILCCNCCSCMTLGSGPCAPGACWKKTGGGTGCTVPAPSGREGCAPTKGCIWGILTGMPPWGIPTWGIPPCGWPIIGPPCWPIIICPGILESIWGACVGGTGASMEDPCWCCCCLLRYSAIRLVCSFCCLRTWKSKFNCY